MKQKYYLSKIIGNAVILEIYYGKRVLSIDKVEKYCSLFEEELDSMGVNYEIVGCDIAEAVKENSDMIEIVNDEVQLLDRVTLIELIYRFRSGKGVTGSFLKACEKAGEAMNEDICGASLNA